jgi:tetratricopeptide (TPR) repeat protein
MTVLVAMCFASCDKFLDEVPDNRTELDTDEKITKLLVSGYANNLFVLTTEMMSDNVDEKESNLTSYSMLQDQMYAWDDIVEVGTESPKSVWERYYGAIAAANQTLEAIEEQGNPERLNPQRGEALMIRAFHHFYLVNVFAKHYSEKTGDSDLGIPYIEAPETTVNPSYERTPVAEVYKKIEQDVETALPLIDDDIYDAPKYHFNRKAAYAFATRFNLFYRKYDKVLEYANEVLGENPNGVLRDFSNIPNLTKEQLPIAMDYIRPDHNANLLLMVGYSNLGVIFGNYGTGKKYMHSSYLAGTETTQAETPWGRYTSTLYRLPSLSYSSGYVTQPKMPYIFEYTDPVAGIGYRHTVYPALQSDEILLCRAEAYIMQGDFENAAKDLDLWVSRHTTSTTKLTRSLINTYYGDLAYYTPYEPTPKKRLNLEYSITAEQENFLQCLLQIRRIETIFEGLRWFDVKRFGIVIYRRYLDANNDVTVQDSLSIDDPRRAIQLPQDVINAGLPPNPRNK